MFYQCLCLSVQQVRIATQPSFAGTSLALLAAAGMCAQDLMNKALASKIGFEDQHAEVLGLVLNQVHACPLPVGCCLSYGLVCMQAEIKLRKVNRQNGKMSRWLRNGHLKVLFV